MKKIIVTGGIGYIGSHTVVELIKKGYEVLILDNLCNSSIEVLNRIKKITKVKPFFNQCDIRDSEKLTLNFLTFKPDAVIHFAGLKAVGESVAQPLMYYDNNVRGSLALLKVMESCQCHTMIFSSSATVYGEAEELPFLETHRLQAVNPYGGSKLMVENVLRDLSAASDQWRLGILRYFNPVGAHPSGLIGEDPSGTPNNLMPYISQVAVGKREFVSVYGNDYPTPDGTGVRDYIHVVDLALGHIKALEYLFSNQELLTVNLGTGNGFSVMDVIHAFEKASNKKIHFEITNRRPGDIAISYANVAQASKLLNWKNNYNLEDMCRDAWNWQSANPNGY